MPASLKLTDEGIARYEEEFGLHFKTWSEILERSDVYAENVITRYEEAKARQWNATRDIPWAELSALPEDLEKATCQLCTFLTEVEFVAGAFQRYPATRHVLPLQSELPGVFQCPGKVDAIYCVAHDFLGRFAIVISDCIDRALCVPLCPVDCIHDARAEGVVEGSGSYMQLYADQRVTIMGNPCGREPLVRQCHHQRGRYR